MRVTSLDLPIHAPISSCLLHLLSRLYQPNLPPIQSEIQVLLHLRHYFAHGPIPAPIQHRLSLFGGAIHLTYLKLLLCVALAVQRARVLILEVTLHAYAFNAKSRRLYRLENFLKHFLLGFFQ